MYEHEVRTYKRLRAEGWRASYAYAHMKRDRALARVEIVGDPDSEPTPWDGVGIIFQWVDDWDYEPDGDYDLEDERAKLASGEWEALVCDAYVPDYRIGPNGGYFDGWTRAGSLGGVVVGSSCIDDAYRREVESDLAYECGVLK